MCGTTAPANRAYLTGNSAKRYRPRRWTPSGPNCRCNVIGLFWITTKIAPLSLNFSGRREAIFDVENAKTSADQILIDWQVIETTACKGSTVNNNYRWMFFSVVWNKSSPFQRNSSGNTLTDTILFDGRPYAATTPVRRGP